jgi:hypothetical protein
VPTYTSSANVHTPEAYSSCIDACEAFLVACAGVSRSSWHAQAGVQVDTTVCVQLCELAVHAMATDGVMAAAVCTASAHCCEALASDCMLLSQPEYRRCAQAAYRAALECRRVALALRSGVPSRPHRTAGAKPCLTSPTPAMRPSVDALANVRAQAPSI